jgi:hypothetical protein
MTALYHTQLEARTCTTSAYQIHHITAETISNPTPGAPDSHGCAPFFSEILGKNYVIKKNLHFNYRGIQVGNVEIHANKRVKSRRNINATATVTSVQNTLPSVVNSERGFSRASVCMLTSALEKKL